MRPESIIKKITGKKPKRSPNKTNNNNSRIGKINTNLILIIYSFIIIKDNFKLICVAIQTQEIC